MILANILRRSVLSCHAFRTTSQQRCYKSLTLENISSHGSLIVRCPTISTRVRCINPHEVPNGDKAFISLTSQTTDNNNNNNNNINLKHFNIDYNKDVSVIQITLPKTVVPVVDEDITVHIEVPHVYNLDVCARCVTVDETEGDDLDITADLDCTLGKIKSMNIDIQCGGNLTANNLFGDGKISAQDLQIKKVQSKHLNVGATSVDIAAAYCLDFTCETADGDVNIRDLHGKATVTSDGGNVSVGSLAGDLSVTTNTGNVDVTVEKCQHVDITSEKGDLDIGVGDNLSAFLEADGSYIDVPEGLLVDGMKYESSSGTQTFEGRYGAGDASVVVKTTSGAVLRVKGQECKGANGQGSIMYNGESSHPFRCRFEGKGSRM